MDIEPIAYFHSPMKEKFGIPRQSGVVPHLPGKIVFGKDFNSPEAIRGLEGFDWIWLIWGFSANRTSPSDNTSFRATVRPPRLGGNKAVGVFASRSPYRPNPLGLSAVKIESIRDNVIHVLGADLMDGTPIFDIKPYVPYTDSHPEARGGFTDETSWKSLEVRISDKAHGQLEEIFADDAPAEEDRISALIAQDPRPHYQDDPEKTYGMKYGGVDVMFRIDGDTAQIIEIN